jgi:uncharacterized protein (TIGR00730 family)
MAEIKNVCVYCGSSPGIDPVYLEGAQAFGRSLAHAKIGLVYGGGGIGLMGAVAHSCLEAGGKVTGIIPDFLVEREQALKFDEKGFKVDHTVIVTKDMHVRKRTMFEQADAFVAMPGGIGTLEELVEQMTWVQLGQHKKPLLLLDLKNFWAPLLALLEHQQAQGFIRRGSFRFLVADQPDKIVPMLRDAARNLSEAELHGPGAKLVAEEM